jgi:hypothetical protein
VIEQNVELRMQIRSPDANVPIGEDTEPATELSDDPWAMMILENDLHMYFRVKQDADGELVLNVETRRGPPA